MPAAVGAALEALTGTDLSPMVFGVDPGCIQIRSGAMGAVRPTGPWVDVLDPGFDLHLRGDRLAKVYAVEEPNAHGGVVSVEAFDAEGRLVVRVFGGRGEGEPWRALVAGLPGAERAS